MQVQRCRDPDLSNHESSVWDALEANNRLRSEPVADGRPGLGCARLQYAVPSPEDAECEPSLSRWNRAAESAHRQHRHQIGGRRRVECPQAWRPETPDLAQDTYRDQ